MDSLESKSLRNVLEDTDWETTVSRETRKVKDTSRALAEKAASLSLVPQEHIKNVHRGAITNIKNMLKATSKKNILYYGVFVQEIPVDTEDAQGELALPVITQERIQEELEKIEKISRKDAEALEDGWLFLGKIQIILKSTFREGINTPVVLVLKDMRFQSRDAQILGAIEGNLKYSTIMFTRDLSYGIAMRDKHIYSSLALAYEFENLYGFKEKSIPFSVTYRISFALGNSHHSVTFKDTDRIYIEPLFLRTSTQEYKKKPKSIESNSEKVDNWFKGNSSKNSFRSNSVRSDRSERIMENLDEIRKEVNSIRENVSEVQDNVSETNHRLKRLI